MRIFFIILSLSSEVSILQSLLYTAAISSAVNPGNYSDEQKPGNARQSKVEINDFGHCSLLSLTEKEIEQRQCRYDIKRKTAQIAESVGKKSQADRAWDASAQGGAK